MPAKPLTNLLFLLSAAATPCRHLRSGGSAFLRLFKCSCGNAIRAGVFSAAAEKNWNSITSFPWRKGAVAPNGISSSSARAVIERRAKASDARGASAVPDSEPTPCIEALLGIESATCAKAPSALETRNIAQSWATVVPTAKSLIFRRLLAPEQKVGGSNPLGRTVRIPLHPSARIPPYTPAGDPAFTMPSSLSSNSKPAVRALWLRVYQR